jgi:hypothetical protein
VITYPAPRIYEETAFIAYYFHWSKTEIMDFSHFERVEWCRRITAINKETSNSPENIFEV